MNKHLRLTGLLAGAIMVAAACSSTGASTAPSVAPSAAPSEAASTAPSEEPSATVDPASLLGQILKTGTIRVATDPNYAPFSFLNPDTQTYEGFDTSTAEETVKRLSEKLGTEIKLQWETPGWDLITAGSWGGRWDISIGSMSVTVGRAKVVDFTEPYYYDSGARRRPDRLHRPVPRRTRRRQDVLRRHRDHLRAVADRHAGDRRPEQGRRLRTDPQHHRPPDRQRVHPVRPGRSHVRRHRRPTATASPMPSPRAPRSASSRVRRSSRSRSRSRSTRAARTRRRSRRSSTRSSPRCTRTARVTALSDEVAREGRHRQAVANGLTGCYVSRPDGSSSGRVPLSEVR